MANYIGADKGFQYLFDAVDDVKNDIAEQYDSTATYAVGNYVLYGNVLYKCITAVSTAESFDNTKWTQVVLTDQIAVGGVSDVQIDNVSVVSGGVANIPSMTGATTASAGTKGLVPAPQAGDEDKFLKGDGTWAVGGGGSSTLANLTDVDLSSPTDGQSLVYDGTNDVWVNGDGGNANEQVLTKAEYDALTEAEKMNNTTYYITDATSWQSKTIQPMIYSEDEREVGVWVDDKPLYQKTFNLNNQTITDKAWTGNLLGTSQSGISIKHYEGYFGLTGQPRLSQFAYYRDSNEYFTCMLNSNEDDISIRPNMNAGLAVTLADVTIWYTKTTDTAGSGIWTPQGLLAQHYSTSEKVIGTWIDGKPLYEKTMPFDYNDVTEKTNTSCTFKFSLPNIKLLVDNNVEIESGKVKMPYVHSSFVIGYFLDFDSDYFYIHPRYSSSTYSDFNNYFSNCYVTIQYTKTTDV